MVGGVQNETTSGSVNNQAQPLHSHGRVTVVALRRRRRWSLATTGSQNWVRSMRAMRIATAPTGCSLLRYFPGSRTRAKARRTLPARQLLPDGRTAEPSTLEGVHAASGLDMEEEYAMAHEVRHGSGDNGHGAVDRDRLREEISPPGNVPGLLAGPVAAQAGPIGPRHTPPPNPAHDRPAARGTRPQAGVRVALTACTVAREEATVRMQRAGGGAFRTPTDGGVRERRCGAMAAFLFVTACVALLAGLVGLVAGSHHGRRGTGRTRRAAMPAREEDST